MAVTNLYSVRNSTPFYVDAFYGKMFGIWGNTKYGNECVNLSYNRALASFIVDNEITEEERRELLYSYLKPQFATDKDTDSLNTLFPSLPSDNGYIKRVLRNICGLFRVPATISIDPEEEIIMDLLDQSNFSFTMKKVHETVKLLNEVIVRPYFVDGRMKLQFVTPDKYRYSVDEYNRITELWVHYQHVDERLRDWVNEDRFHVWTAETYRKVNSQGIDITPAQPNPYGRIPYLVISLDESGIDRREMWGGSLWELLKAQLYANKLDFLSDQNLTYNGFSMWVLLNFGLTEQNLKMGAGRVLIKDGVYGSDDYPIPPSAETVSPDAQYQEIEDIKLRKIKQALKNMELPASAIEDNPGLAQSGTAIRLERTGLEEIRIADAAIMRSYVKDLIKLIILVANTDPASNYKGNLGEADNYDIEIDFNEMEIPDEPKAAYELNTTMFKDGILSPLNYVKKFVSVDTVTTDEEAIDYILNNKELLKLLGGADESDTENNGGLDERVATGSTTGAEGTTNNTNVQSTNDQNNTVGAEGATVGTERE